MSFGFQVDEGLAGKRLDVALADTESLSRAQLRRLIDAGHVRVDGRVVKAAHRLRSGERVEGAVPAPRVACLGPEAIPLAIVYEDSHLVVVDKPAGLVVHPAPGHASGTLVHALLHHCTDLSGVGGVLRPGIVHRLDKGTSGLLVAAKTDAAHQSLAAQFKAHDIDREYVALVRAQPRADSGVVNAPIGRHPHDGKRFTTRRPARPRQALTRWLVAERYAQGCLLRVRPETGRTHQIRVHLASIGLPILGDPDYGNGRQRDRAFGLERQALHAMRLGFTHPATREGMRFEVELPQDLLAAIQVLAD